jgi:hypothetical protein
MLTFLEANIGEPQKRSGASDASQPSASGSRQGMNVGLGWHTLSVGRNAIVFHTGGTGGYRSFVGFDPVAGRESCCWRIPPSTPTTSHFSFSIDRWP